jgi:hypothetical protein
MIRHRTAAIAATTITALALIGGGIAYAAGAVNVPNSGGQLTGTVDICVNTANEGQQYVELFHPAPGNCAAGYLQYTANQPADVDASTAPPVALVNSETFKTAAVAGDKFTVSLPAGSHVVAGSVSAVDLDATIAVPDVVTVKSVDTVTGMVTVTYSAGTVGHSIQVTYEYSFN